MYFLFCMSRDFVTLLWHVTWLLSRFCDTSRDFCHAFVTLCDMSRDLCHAFCDIVWRVTWLLSRFVTPCHIFVTCHVTFVTLLWQHVTYHVTNHLWRKFYMPLLPLVLICFLWGLLRHGSTNHENALTKFGINHVKFYVTWLTPILSGRPIGEMMSVSDWSVLTWNTIQWSRDICLLCNTLGIVQKLQNYAQKSSPCVHNYDFYFN
jgi:hypothetical protein